MAKLQELEKYLDYKFSTGCDTGEDYKQFERKYINYLKSLCKENGWELVNVCKNHYQFSAFFKCENKYIYMSISDVRFWNNEWYNHILFRTAEHERDYYGGQNLYTTLPLLRLAILNMFNKGF
jgi:hypothetical protein